MLVYCFRFTNFEDKTWFESTLTNVLKQQVGEEIVSLVPAEPYFVDFLRDAPEPTGEEVDDSDFDAPKVNISVKQMLYIVDCYCDNTYQTLDNIRCHWGKLSILNCLL